VLGERHKNNIINRRKFVLENTIKLPEPQKDLEFPLMKALEKRRTIRKWSNIIVSEQEISNLLWAACGITKNKYGNVKSKRTAPSACNSQEIRVYIIIKQGVFLYNEESHELIEIIAMDIREHIGTQKMMKTAPMGLVFVADLSRMISPFVKSKEAQRFCAWVDTGYISQNVYLYCAASNLGTAVLSLVDREKLHKLMKLKDHEKIVLTQAIGHLT
jgi:SagB-type dehydrogenase family enzyme